MSDTYQTAGKCYVGAVYRRSEKRPESRQQTKSKNQDKAVFAIDSQSGIITNHLGSVIGTA
jgi:hypothetical protein